MKSATLPERPETDEPELDPELDELDELAADQENELDDTPPMS